MSSTGLKSGGWALGDWALYSWIVPTGYTATSVQVKVVKPSGLATHVQVRLVAYNVTQLRILWEIKSDGITSGNFSSSSYASADKQVINLKSDIVEKYWQSTGLTEWVQWDAGSGKTIILDTFGLIAHNLTSSAVVTLKGYGAGSDSAPSDWSVVGVYATLTMPDDPDEDNLIWISPSIPTTAFRYWRLDILDTTNPAGYVRAGRLVAGASLIFNVENCIEDISFQNQNFKDEFKLNGFQGISNNRALKKSMRIDFRDLDRVALANYRALKRYTKYCRDTLKALVIVDPRSESTKYLFTVFSKLASMPVEQHKFVASDSSYTTMTLEYNEGR